MAKDIKPGRKPKAPKIDISNEWIENYKRYYPLIEQKAKKFGIDPKIAFKTFLLESGSQKNPTNLFQLKAGSITDVGMSGLDMSDPELNTEAAMRYMSMLRNQGIPMEEMPTAWRLGKLGYDQHKMGLLKNRAAKDDLTSRLWWGSAADQFLSEPPTLASDKIKPISDERIGGSEQTLPEYKEGVGSVIQRYLKNLLGF